MGKVYKWIIPGIITMMNWHVWRGLQCVKSTRENLSCKQLLFFAEETTPLSTKQRNFESSDFWHNYQDRVKGGNLQVPAFQRPDFSRDQISIALGISLQETAVTTQGVIGWKEHMKQGGTKEVFLTSCCRWRAEKHKMTKGLSGRKFWGSKESS